MPGGRTKFQDKWLDAIDGDGDIIRKWCCRGRKEMEAYCTLCKSHFSVANGGISQVLQHSKSLKHASAKKNMKGQQTLFSATNPSNTPLISAHLDADQLVTRAEALWAMKTVQSNISFSASKDIVPLFQAMFEGHPVANGMKISERKMSYIVSHGLGPYFQEQTVDDLKTSIATDSFFCLAFDETTNSQIKKQLDLYVRYWSSKSDSVVCAYMNSVFLGHADSDAVCKSILSTLSSNSIPLHKIVMLCMDGPNVNLAVAKKLNAELLKIDCPDLVNIGTCSLHKLHGSFSKALALLPVDLDDFASDLFTFFKLSAARREDLKNIQQLIDCEQKFILRHVNSRWISLGPVLLRILYPSLQEYFLKFLPKQNGNVISQHNARYHRIITWLKEPTTVAYMEFVCSVTTVLENYLTMFQSVAPLVHLLHSRINELLRLIMLRFLKPECVGNLEGKKLMDVDIESTENFLPLTDMDVGMGAKRVLSKLKEQQRKNTQLEMRSFLIALLKNLKSTLPVSNPILRKLEHLHPLMRTESSDVAIRSLCVNMKPLKMDNVLIDNIVQEWKMYKLDSEVGDLYNTQCRVMETELRIDKYWGAVFNLKNKTGAVKYRYLPKLIKPCLSLGHGNSDVERGFSINNAMVSSDRPNLAETTIIGLRHVKDGLMRQGGVLNVAITKKLLNRVARSHSQYAADKKREQELAKEEQRKRACEEEESRKASEKKRLKEEKKEKLVKIEKKIMQLQESLDASHTLLTEGSERLQRALSSKNIKEASVASTMVETASQKVKSLGLELREAQDKRCKMQAVL